jgi:thiamine biosynthesis lipoprotein
MTRVEFVMGMPIAIDVRGEDADPEVVERAFDWLRFVDATFSTYDEESEVSRLERGELDLDEAHPDMREVLRRCELLREETGGYFDAHATGRLDPSGLVKGWSVDRAGWLLDAAGIENYCINAGGDIRVRGGALPEPDWSIGIKHPLLACEIAAVVQTTGPAVATSGAYERGEHIVDPHSGTPPTGVLSVTVVGPDLAQADAYATAAYAMGPEGPAWTAQLTELGYEALTILVDEVVVSTASFPA